MSGVRRSAFGRGPTPNAEHRTPVRGTGSDGTRQTTSPASPSRCRLVASTRSAGQRWSSVWTTAAAASSRCSQLSSTSRRRSVRQPGDQPPRAAHPRRRRRPRRAGPAPPPPSAGPALRPPAAPSSTQAAPSEAPSTACSATSRASRVFPTPPPPISVTSRDLLQRLPDLRHFLFPPNQRRERARERRWPGAGTRETLGHSRSLSPARARVRAAAGRPGGAPRPGFRGRGGWSPHPARRPAPPAGGWRKSR